MEVLRQVMTYEEFEVYPRKLGWIVEYYADAMHLSPASTAIAKFCLALDDLPRLRQNDTAKLRASVIVRPLAHSDLAPLVSLFVECFTGGIDYAGSDASRLELNAHRTLDRFFGPSPPDTLNACRVAIEDNQIVGGCMIDRGKHGPLLQPIFVAPSHQRRGLATMLLFDATESLADHSEKQLSSRCHLGNDASMAWHLQCGFAEVPSRWSAAHRANFYMQEAERHALLGLASAAAMQELADHWGDEWERLEAQGALEEF